VAYGGGRAPTAAAGRQACALLGAPAGKRARCSVAPERLPAQSLGPSLTWLWVDLHAAPRSAVLPSPVLCCAVLCCAVLCCAALRCAVLCCAVLCCAVLCYVPRCAGRPQHAPPRRPSNPVPACHTIESSAVPFCAPLPGAGVRRAANASPPPALQQLPTIFACSRVRGFHKFCSIICPRLTP
jgi:hypothetical protein